MKDANLIHEKKRRLLCLLGLGLLITFLEGIILISLFLVFTKIGDDGITWTLHFPGEIKKSYCNWFLKMLFVGAPASLFIGIIAQLLWQNRRITEVIRK